MATAIEEGSVHFLSEKLLMEFLEQDVMSKIRHLFHMLDMNDDGTISMTELVVAINDPLFRRGLRSIFPTLDPVSLLGSATLMDGELGPEQFHDLCKKHADKGKLESCIYFPMVVAGEPSAVGAFPKAAFFWIFLRLLAQVCPAIDSAAGASQLPLRSDEVRAARALDRLQRPLRQLVPAAAKLRMRPLPPQVPRCPAAKRGIDGPPIGCSLSLSRIPRR